MGDFRSNLPLGTNDKDVFLKGNVPNYDEAVNAQYPEWLDRFGVSRLTWFGMEENVRLAILKLNYSEVEYQAGNVIDALLQYVLAPDGNAYVISPSVELPYTLTGDWATDSPNFWLGSDLTLAGRLSSPSGADLIPTVSRVVKTIADLRLLKKTGNPYAITLGYHSEGDGGGGMYYLDASDASSAENGGTVIVANDGGRWKLNHNGTVSIKNFGARGNDVDNDSPAIQAAIDWARPNKVLFAPEGRYVLRETVTADYPLNLYGVGGMGFRGQTPSSSLIENAGTVFVSEVSTGYAIAISPDLFSFGGALDGFSITGRSGALNGLRMHNVGWTGRVCNVTIQGFVNTNLSLGYLQDTHFERVTLLSGGNDQFPLLEFEFNSNYLYFDNCRFEDTEHTLRDIGGAWEIHFTNCHFENGDYKGALGPNFDHPYANATFRWNSSSEAWSFTNCTFVPVSTESLLDHNGGTISNQPYYMDGTLWRSKFIGCRWIAPSGRIDPISLHGDFSRNFFTNCRFENVNPTRFSIRLSSAEIIGGSVILYDDGGSIYEGILVDQGKILGLTIAGNITGTKTGGILIASSKEGQLMVDDCSFEFAGGLPHRYVGAYCQLGPFSNVSGWYNFSDQEVVDMEKVQPGFGLRPSANAITLAGIINRQRGRSFKILNDFSACTVKFVPFQVITRGGNDLVMGAASVHLFESDVYGTVYQVS